MGCRDAPGRPRSTRRRIPNRTRRRSSLISRNVHHALTTKKCLPVFTQRGPRDRDRAHPRNGEGAAIHRAALSLSLSLSLCPKGCDNPFPPEQVRLIRIRANHRHCVRLAVRPSVRPSRPLARLPCSAAVAAMRLQIRHETRHQTGLHFSSRSLSRNGFDTEE